jgi:hypothetical protein
MPDHGGPTKFSAFGIKIVGEWLLPTCAQLRKGATAILVTMNIYSLLGCLVLTINRKTAHWAFSAWIGVRLSRRLDMDFGDSTSTHLGE